MISDRYCDERSPKQDGLRGVYASYEFHQSLNSLRHSQKFVRVVHPIRSVCADRIAAINDDYTDALV